MLFCVTINEQNMCFDKAYSYDVNLYKRLLLKKCINAETNSYGLERFGQLVCVPVTQKIQLANNILAIIMNESLVFNWYQGKLGIVQGFTHGKSILVKAVITWTNANPDLNRQVASLGYNEKGHMTGRAEGK